MVFCMDVRDNQHRWYTMARFRFEYAKHRAVSLVVLLPAYRIATHQPVAVKIYNADLVNAQRVCRAMVSLYDVMAYL